MNVWGNKIKLSIFGESHGEALGIVIDGIEAGTKINFEKISRHLDRRKAGKNTYTSPRKEKDNFKFLSGIKDNLTTGSPLTVIFENTNTRSKDYGNLENLLRPSHADYPAKIKFNGFNDFRGGGHFSGRLTLALTFAGAIALEVLAEKNIRIFSHIKKIGQFEDESFLEKNDFSTFESLKEKELPLININLEEEIKNFLETVKKEGNTVGGIVECACYNIPIGIGSPFFDSLESKISHLAFSIPAVKGVEFGIGFSFANKLGSEANDLFYLDKDKIKTETNNNGGILGGLSTGMPIVFSLVVKPISSIALKQKTVNIKEMKEEFLEIEGRHDSTIVTRILPVVEGVAALAILDEIL